MKSFKEFINEDAPVNAAGGGAIAGIGVGPDGEPGVSPKAHKKHKKKNKKEYRVAMDMIS
jgi:hypothetical protein